MIEKVMRSVSGSTTGMHMESSTSLPIGLSDLAIGGSRDMRGNHGREMIGVLNGYLINSRPTHKFVGVVVKRFGSRR